MSIRASSVRYRSSGLPYSSTSCLAAFSCVSQTTTHHSLLRYHWWIGQDLDDSYSHASRRSSELDVWLAYQNSSSNSLLQYDKMTQRLRLISHERQCFTFIHNHKTTDDSLTSTNVESLTLRPNGAVFYAAYSCLIDTASSYETVPIGIPRHLSFHAVLLLKTR